MNQVITSPPSPAELLTELDLGSARGGRAGGQNSSPLSVQIVRSLVADDLAAIQSPPPVAAGAQQVKTLRHSHHRLAELIAKGASGAEISLTTGYSASYISIIQGDPAFAELIAYYESQKQTIFVDAMERLRVVGLDAAEKLHEQLHDSDVVWTKRELMELIDMTVVKPATAKTGTGAVQAPGTGLSLEVRFVGAQPREVPPTIEAIFSETPQQER